MQNSSSASHWLDGLTRLGSVGTFLLGIAALIGAWVARKKRSTQNAEILKLEGEAELDRAGAADKYGRLALEMVDKVRETQKVIGFLEQQLRYRSQMEVIARNRTHRAIGELQAAVLAIREREELLRTAKVEFTEYRVKTQEEIFGQEDLPLPPDIHDTIA